ncbi:hypothetical protein KIPB_004912 [Kipferlia bialata]|uniref:Uncharacterized protein n=1 Tax=Kipferlia bialata TaxID=797122 RepID=A0A9K3CV85_9EUKA|nr:hypothetical protein KIPB_004912 [Kipferlia bialata]|eukprot:g4912.t1
MSDHTPCDGAPSSETSDFDLNPVSPPAEPSDALVGMDVSKVPLDPLALRMLHMSMRIGRVFLVLACLAYAVCTVIAIQESVVDYWPDDALSKLGVPTDEPASSGWYNGGIIVLAGGLLIHHLPVFMWIQVRPPLPARPPREKAEGVMGMVKGVPGYVLPHKAEAVMWQIVSWCLLLDFVGLMGSGFLNDSYGWKHQKSVTVSAVAAILALLLMIPLTLHSRRTACFPLGTLGMLLLLELLGPNNVGLVPYAVYELGGIVGAVGVQVSAGYCCVEYPRGSIDVVPVASEDVKEEVVV